MSQDKYAEHVLPVGVVPQQPHSWRRERAKGRSLRTTLLVGQPSAVVMLHQQLLRQPRHDYRVIGCCLPTVGGIGESFDGLAVLGGPDDVVDVVRRYCVDTVAVLPSPQLNGAALRRLECDLEPTRADLLLAPAVIGSAASRMPSRTVGGRPRLQKARPGLRGVRGLVKASFDRAATALLLLLVAPVLIGVTVCVKLTSRGPVFAHQERVGRDGRLFSMLTFRITEIDAQRTPDCLAAETGGERSEFPDYPGETRLGSILRRYSMDELPQLFNVLKGDMSLVGPRPGLRGEIGRFGVDEARRLLVKPGLTGLGQLSGSSRLSRDDWLRIDVDYVENWSLGLDLNILRKTFAAVLRGDGVP
jgi:lipopolysaccharide/colanic/teichoic acid biosynthesis glycosyltransferase